MRIALPKGRLLPPLMQVCASVGISMDVHHERSYKLSSSYVGADIKLFKARSIPTLVAFGNIDIGFCGLDIVANTGYQEITELLITPFNPVDIVVAAPRGKEDIVDHPPKRPLLIATEYELIAHQWAFRHNLAHIVLQTYGATEAYPPDDADIIIDCVETGDTLVANNLVLIEKLFRSTTVLIAKTSALHDPKLSKSIENFKHSFAQGLSL